MPSTPAHITINGTPYCDWLGCPAGQDIKARSGVCTCDQPSLAAGWRAVRALRPFFAAGVAVRVVPGRCVSA
jgi:hypothetical protein